MFLTKLKLKITVIGPCKPRVLRLIPRIGRHIPRSKLTNSYLLVNLILLKIATLAKYLFNIIIHKKKSMGLFSA